MASTGAFIVRLDMKSKAIVRVEKKACPGVPVRLGDPGAEKEVCGIQGRYDIAGIWLCLVHYNMVLREAGLHSLAAEDRAVRLGTCVFPVWGASAVHPEVALVCGAPSAAGIGTASVCANHLEAAMAWHREMSAREEAIAEEAEERRERLRDAELERWDAQGWQVVYYVRRASDGAIKIGTSTEFWRRHRSLAREHGELQILLTHCGGYGRENEAHRRFAALRIGGEWFAPGLELLEWILRVRRKRANAATVTPETVRQGEVMALLREARSQKAA